MEEAGGMKVRLEMRESIRPNDFHLKKQLRLLTCTQRDFVRQNHEICVHGTGDTLLDLRISSLLTFLF